jgi:hypothetical protein
LFPKEYFTNFEFFFYFLRTVDEIVYILPFELFYEIILDSSLPINAAAVSNFYTSFICPVTEHTKNNTSIFTQMLASLRISFCHGDSPEIWYEDITPRKRLCPLRQKRL